MDRFNHILVFNVKDYKNGSDESVLIKQKLWFYPIHVSMELNFLFLFFIKQQKSIILLWNTVYIHSHAESICMRYNHRFHGYRLQHTCAIFSKIKEKKIIIMRRTIQYPIKNKQNQNYKFPIFSYKIKAIYCYLFTLYGICFSLYVLLWCGSSKIFFVKSFCNI